MEKFLKKIVLLMVLAVILVSVSGWVIQVKAEIQIKLAKKSCKLNIGGTSQIKIKNVDKAATITYKTNKKNVASVSKKGVVTALTAGVAKVTVSINENGKKTNLKYMVTVKKPAPKKKKITINVGDTVPLDIKNRPGSDSDYTVDIVSSKKNIVGTVSRYENDDKVIGITDKEIERTGLDTIFEGKREGTTKLKVIITAKGKSYSATIKVTVKGNEKTDNGFDTIYNKYPGLKSMSENGILSVCYQDKPDTISLGSWDLEYFDDGNFVGDGKKENLEWEILEYSEDKKSAQVISKYIITQRPFNDKNAEDVTWENCSLRSWLNEDFYNMAFSEEEKALIHTSYLRNDALNDPVYGMKSCGADTEDKLFLLSLSDIQYFYRTEALGSYSINRVARYIDGQVDSWWLRSLAGCQYHVSLVDEDGYVRYSYSKNMNNDDMPAGIAYNIYGNCGVRPSFWISLTPEIIEANNLSIGEDYHSEFEKGKYWITMGQWDYEGGENEKLGSMPIEWQILDYDKNENKLLLLSEKLITEMHYNEGEEESVTWESSSLRRWLNNDFYNNAFSDSQKSMIVSSYLINDNNDTSYISGGSNTTDKVFLLSLSDVDTYFSAGRDKYAYERICSFYDNVVSCWWLRTPPREKQIMAGITDDGLAYYSWRVNSYKLGVRPAIWVYLK